MHRNLKDLVFSFSTSVTRRKLKRGFSGDRRRRDGKGKESELKM
jgi:hypothetical protein